MQRTGELIITAIIDPELERIKKALLFDVFTTPWDDESILRHISTILTKEYENPTIEELDRFITKVPILLKDPGLNYEEKDKISQKLEENRNILFELESDTDLSINRIHYHYNLEAIKESIIYIIQQPQFLSHLIKKHKHSSKVRIYLYKIFFRKEYSIAYEAFDNIYNGIDSIDNEIYVFKRLLQQR